MDNDQGPDAGGELSPQSFPGVRRLLATCAERAPRQVSFSEAAQAAEMPETQLRGELGALTKVAKRLFHGDLSWPVSVRYGDAGEARYAMDTAVAQWWLASASGQE